MYNIKEILYEVINEANKGKVKIASEEWNIAFNTKIQNSINNTNDKNLSTLIIKDEDKFLSYLKIYIEKELLLNRHCPNYLEDKERNKIEIRQLKTKIDKSTIANNK